MVTARQVDELEDELLDDEDADEEELEYFYDYYENYIELRHKRGDMPNSDHNHLVDYLLAVLQWLFFEKPYTIEREVNFHETINYKDRPRYPDVFVLKSRPTQRMNSYKVNIEGPPPELIIEVLSAKTRTVDLKKKPGIYARWGVQEYFVYDPRPRYRRSKYPRLYGWRLVAPGASEEIKAEADGRMWSEQAESWLVPDDDYVRLYDRDGNLRLRQVEAEAQAKREALLRESEARVQLERERREKEAALREIERLRRELDEKNKSSDNNSEN